LNAGASRPEKLSLKTGMVKPKGPGEAFEKKITKSVTGRDRPAE